MMYYLPYSDLMAAERQKDLLRDAERFRLFDAVRDGGIGRNAAVRRPLGAALVRAGELIQGSRDRALPDGEVRLAR